MANLENSTVAEPGSIERRSIVANKEELVATFNKLSDEEKTQFYKDCEEGISAEQSRQNMLQFVRQLWQK